MENKHWLEEHKWRIVALAVLLVAAATGITANQIRTAVPTTVSVSGIAAAEGTSISMARADHAHSLTGTLPVGNGGTGITTTTLGDIIIGGGGGAAFTRLSDVAAGGILISNGVGAAPKYLAGTATANKVLMSGASADASWSTPTYPNALSPPLGRYIKADGTNWIQSTGSASGVGTPTACSNQFVTGLTLSSDAAPTSTCTTDTLASAQHANQGTTTTLLHGNAAGNPSWAQASLTADVTGVLPTANGGTNKGTAYAVGDVVYASGTTTLAGLADVATGQVLTSGGLNLAPAYSATPSLTYVTVTGTGGDTPGRLGTENLIQFSASIGATTGTTCGPINYAFNGAGSCVRNSIGNYTWTFATALASGSYVPHCSVNGTDNCCTILAISNVAINWASRVCSTGTLQDGQTFYLLGIGP